MTTKQTGPAVIKQRYDRCASERTSVLERGRQASEITIPSILPAEGFTETSQLPIPYQSLGARGVLNLSSRLTTALMPPNYPFFRLIPNQKYLEEDEEITTDHLESIGVIERKVLEQINASAIRNSIDLGLQHLIVTGNCCFYLTSSFTLRVYRLDQYIVRRAPDGTILEVITFDCIDPLSISRDLYPILGLDFEEMDASVGYERGVEMYTQAKRTPEGKWDIVQEINGYIVPGSEKTISLNPFIVPRWRSMAGHNYGRGHAEDNIGDLRTYEGLQKALLEAAAIMSQLKFLVDPTQPYTKVDDLAKSNNGAYIAGRRKDVETLQSEKAMDLTFVANFTSSVQERLGYAFLLNSAIQPEGERVTAYQVRKLAEEIEGTLGGIYSTLALEILVPLLEQFMDLMKKNKMLPQFQGDLFKPQILTGFEALGRERGLMNMRTFAEMQAIFGNEGLAAIDQSEWAKRSLLYLGENPDGLILTPEEIQAKMAAAMAQQQAIQSAGAIAETLAGQPQTQL